MKRITFIILKSITTFTSTFCKRVYSLPLIIPINTVGSDQGIIFLITAQKHMTINASRTRCKKFLATTIEITLYIYRAAQFKTSSASPIKITGSTHSTDLIRQGHFREIDAIGTPHLERHQVVPVLYLRFFT